MAVGIRSPAPPNARPASFSSIITPPPSHNCLVIRSCKVNGIFKAFSHFSHSMSHSHCGVVSPLCSPTIHFKRRIAPSEFPLRALKDENFGEEPEVDKALSLDPEIPSTSEQFIEKMSSKAYEMRGTLEQSIDANTYDVLEKNPYRDSNKPVYILAKEPNRVYTMRTRRNRSEIENELNKLFSSGRRNRQSEPGISFSSSRKSKGSLFRMHVEDVREGVLVFEDEEVASKYCSILENQGEKCLGVAQIEANDIFAMCQKSNALAVLFRRGITPPLPDRLQMKLKARKRSLED